jgi:hypothetical protein
MDTVKREAVVSDGTLHRIAPDALFDGRGYLSTRSDIAALMVFQHQAHMINLITRAGWEARLHAGPLRDTVNELVDYLLFVEEEPMTAAVDGDRYSPKCSAQGPTATADRCVSSTSNTVAAVSLQLSDLLRGVSRAAR